MKKDDLDMISFGIIADAGDARTFAFEALQAAENREYARCDVQISKAHASINKARRAQTDLLFEEMNGEHQEVNVLLVHSQDHLMDAQLAIDLIEQMIARIRIQEKLETRIGRLEEHVDELERRMDK